MAEAVKVVRLEKGPRQEKHAFALVRHPDFPTTLVVSAQAHGDDLVRHAVGLLKMKRDNVKQLRSQEGILFGEVRHTEDVVVLETEPTDGQRLSLARALKRAWPERNYLITSNFGEKSHGRASIILAREKTR